MTPEETERLNALLAINAGALTVPRPTPDEDGVYHPIAQAEISTRPSWSGRPMVVLDLAGVYFLWPGKAEALGAALIAAAQDARRIAAEAAQEEP